MDATRHVMVVDDEEDFLEMMRVLLESERFRVSSCSDAALAVRRVCDGLTPDIVLMDFRMPVHDGADALRRMRECSLASPAVLVSGTRDIGRLADANGFDAWLQKPFDFEALLGVIAHCLGRA